MNPIAQFDQESINNALVEFVPANVQVVGKNASERRMNVVSTAGAAASMFLLSQGGKIGKQAAQNIVGSGMDQIGTAASRGHYKPLAEALSGITGESTMIQSRHDYEALTSQFTAKLSDIQAGKNGGMNATGDKMGAKLRGVTQALMLIKHVQDVVAAVFASKDAE